MVLSNEEFAKQVIGSFNELRKEIKEIKQDYNDLDKRISIHLKVEEELEDYQNQLDNRKNRKFYVYMALMGSAFTIYEITKGLFV
jgi:FtsZ-binding cell division protein ZapB